MMNAPIETATSPNGLLEMIVSYGIECPFLAW